MADIHRKLLPPDAKGIFIDGAGGVPPAGGLKRVDTHSAFQGPTEENSDEVARRHVVIVELNEQADGWMAQRDAAVVAWTEALELLGESETEVAQLKATALKLTMRAEKAETELARLRREDSSGG